LCLRTFVIVLAKQKYVEVISPLPSDNDRFFFFVAVGFV
jgi:hypothetical protein